jgi:hypothetical protein
VSQQNISSLDVNAVRFPSDRLTIGMLRSAHPQLFDTNIGGGKPQPQFFFAASDNKAAVEEVGGILYTERLIAAVALATRDGQEPPATYLPLHELKEELAERYVRYGLASGPQHALELIRDIERQVQPDNPSLLR